VLKEGSLCRPDIEPPRVGAAKTYLLLGLLKDLGTA